MKPWQHNRVIKALSLGSIDKSQIYQQFMIKINTSCLVTISISMPRKKLGLQFQQCIQPGGLVKTINDRHSGFMTFQCQKFKGSRHLLRGIVRGRARGGMYFSEDLTKQCFCLSDSGKISKNQYIMAINSTSSLISINHC